MEQNGSNSTKKLASASELRGKKAGNSEKKARGQKMWLSLISLMLVLGLAVGVYFLADIIKPQEKPEVIVNTTLPPSNTVKIIGRNRADVASVTIDKADEEPYTIVSTITYNGEGENVHASYSYSIEGLPNFRLHQSDSNTIIGYAANLTATKQIAENVEDFSPYGLDKPSVTITMKYRDGSQEVWLMGMKVPASTGHYMCRQGSRTVFQVYTMACEAFSKSLNELYVLRMPVLFSDTTIVDNLLIEQKGKDTIELQRVSGTENTFSISDVKLVQPVEYDAQGDRGNTMMDDSTYLHIKQYAGEKSNLPEAGLDDPRARIRVTDTDGNVLNYIVGNYAPDGSVYVQIDDTDTVYLSDASRLSFLNNANVNYLIDQYTNLVNIEKVDSVKVTAGSEVYNASIVRQSDEEVRDNSISATTYFFDGVETSEKEFKAVYSTILGMMVSKLIDGEVPEGEVIASIQYTLNVAPYEFTVEYLAYDNDYYAVRRNGSTLFLIKQDRVHNMVEQIKHACDTVK